MNKLDGYTITYLPEKITLEPYETINVSYETLLDGYNELNKVEHTAIIKIAFIDSNGKLRIIEDTADNFKFDLPNRVINVS